MNKDCGFVLSKLNVDGKLSGNNLLMQLQSDLCGIPVCELLAGILGDGANKFLIIFQFEPSIEIILHWEWQWLLLMLKE